MSATGRTTAGGARHPAGKGGAGSESEAFWLDIFAVPPPPVDLPLDRPRPKKRGHWRAVHKDRIGEQTCQAAIKAGEACGASAFSTLFAAFQVLAGRLAGADDVVVAVPVTAEGLALGGAPSGHYETLLALRAPFDPSAPFSSHLRAVERHVSQALAHRDYPFETLSAKLSLPPMPGRLPLTGLQFAFEPETVAQPGEGHGPQTLPPEGADFDISFALAQVEGGLRIECGYDADIFDAATIARWTRHFRTLLKGIADAPDCPIGDLPLLSPEESAWLIDGLNATAAPYRRDTPLDTLIAEQAAKTPDRIAIVCGDTALTFADVEARANRLARYLRERVPAGASRVAVALARSPELPVALLAVLKAGCAYVPLDPGHPAARNRLVAETGDVAAVICDAPDMAALVPPGAAVIDLGEAAAGIAALDAGPLPPLPPDPERAAYVMFTSGSTGTPKGVEVPHRALVNFLESMARTPGFSADDVIVAVTTVSFDIAGLELWLPLITGGRAVIASRTEVVDGVKLIRLIETSGATMLQATPSLWRLLLEAGFRPRPGIKMLCGGEALPRDLADTLAAGGAELWNMYGPTETTIWSSCGRVGQGPQPVTIGAPIANTQLHILDARGRLVPPGVTGGLYIGGEGLATGYFNRPDLTAAAFTGIALDGRPPQRLYRTGDLARRLADGGIQHLGRADHQVKLRGFRIELEEIEAALLSVPGVAAAAAAIQSGPDGEARLTGYYVGANGDGPAPDDLVRHLAAQLPDYMVPSAWAALDALPLTPNGKLNRKALPLGTPLAASSGSDAAPVPAGGLEEQIAQIWADVLGVAAVGMDANFFDLGGHSLLAVRMLTRVFEVTGLRPDFAALMQAPVLRDFVAVLKAAGVGAMSPGDAWKVIPVQTKGSKTAVIGIDNAGTLYALARRLGDEHPLICVRIFDPGRPRVFKPQTFEEIAAEYVEVIRQSGCRGPYVLFGLCVHGVLAIEIARQLREAGENVPLAAAVNCWAPGYSSSLPRATQRLLRWHDFYKNFLTVLRGEKSLLAFLGTYSAVHKSGLLTLAHRLGLIKAIPPRSGDPENDPLLRHLERAYKRFHPKPFGGDLLLFRDDSTPRMPQFEDALGWRRYVVGRCQVRWTALVRGGKPSDPGVADVAGHLCDALKEVEARRGKPAAS